MSVEKFSLCVKRKIPTTCGGLDYSMVGSVVLNDRIRELYKQELDLKSSFRVYSAITFIIALLGIFGLFLFTIKKKTKEVCIRQLFGASLRDTFILLIKEQLLIVTKLRKSMHMFTWQAYLLSSLILPERCSKSCIGQELVFCLL